MRDLSPGTSLHYIYITVSTLDTVRAWYILVSVYSICIPVYLHVYLCVYLDSYDVLAAHSRHTDRQYI